MGLRGLLGALERGLLVLTAPAHGNCNLLWLNQVVSSCESRFSFEQILLSVSTPGQVARVDQLLLNREQLVGQVPWLHLLSQLADDRLSLLPQGGDPFNRLHGALALVVDLNFNVCGFFLVALNFVLCVLLGPSGGILVLKLRI